MPEGLVAALRRWPVKSLGGELLDEVTLTANGVSGDRAHAVVDAAGGTAPLSARQLPRLLAWSATYPPEAGEADGPRVTSPGGRVYAWHDRELSAALSEDLGRPVTTSAVPARNHDRPGTVLVTTEATRRALETELGSPVDVRRFRTNLHLDLEAPPYAEEGWEGRTLRFASGVRLRFRGPCERCTVPTHDPDRPDRRRPEVLRWLQLNRAAVFGVIATVEEPGPVKTAERVAITRS